MMTETMSKADRAHWFQLAMKWAIESDQDWSALYDWSDVESMVEAGWMILEDDGTEPSLSPRFETVYETIVA